ncbi:MAG: hypothetical protein EON58_06170, partial [Alphaproteobacteria bacterium]
MKLLRATLVLFVIASATSIVPPISNKPTMAESQIAVVTGCRETNEAIADLEEAIKQASASVRENTDSSQPPINDPTARSIPKCRANESAVLAHYEEQKKSWEESAIVKAIYIAQAFLLLIPLMIATFYLASRMRSGKDAAHLNVILANRRLRNFSLLAVFAFVIAGYIVPMLKASEARREFVRLNGFEARESHLYAPFMISVDGYEPDSGISFHGSCTTSTRFF